jgi:hypothetical protein
MDYKTVNSDCQFLPLVVSTGSTTVLGLFLPPLVVSTGSTTVLGAWPVLSTVGGFDRLNHRSLLLASKL